MKTLAIVGATVLTMSGADLQDATVIIEGDRIFRRFLRQAADAGLPFAIGSDAVVAGIEPGTAMLRELEVLAAAGIPNALLLRAATVTGARLLRRPDRGTIAPGQRADLLLLDADPRVDISAIGAVTGVVRAGSFSPRPRGR